MTDSKINNKCGKSSDVVDSSDTMDKYSVDQDSDQKLACKTGECPWCGTPLLTHGLVFLCPIHGSEPFER